MRVEYGLCGSTRNSRSPCLHLYKFINSMRGPLQKFKRFQFNLKPFYLLLSLIESSYLNVNNLMVEIIWNWSKFFFSWAVLRILKITIIEGYVCFCLITTNFMEVYKLPIREGRVELAKSTKVRIYIRQKWRRIS